MKKTIIAFMASIGLIVIGCLNTSDKRNQLSKSAEIVDIPENSPLNPPLEKAVDEVLDYIKSSTHDTNPDKELINLIIDDHKLAIFTTPYYLEGVKGYGYYKGQTFIYYGENNRIRDFIDVDKIVIFQDTIPGFWERFKKYGDSDFDPYGIEYTIVTKDSLIIERKGML